VNQSNQEQLLLWGWVKAKMREYGHGRIHRGIPYVIDSRVFV